MEIYQFLITLLLWIMAKKQLTLLQQKYLDVAKLFHWGRQIDFTAWFTGVWNPRNKQTETTLPQLVEMKELYSRWYHGQLIYTTSKRASDLHVPHGLTCTRAAIRLKHAIECEFIPERFFRGWRFEIVPEFAFMTDKAGIAFEYSTKNNFKRPSLMRRKLQKYRETLARFEETFDVRPVVLFVIDAPIYEVKRFAKYGDANFYFTDARSFFGVDMKAQLTSSIYIWGGDGDTYSLRS